MTLKKFLKRKIFGGDFHEEYICLEKETLSEPFKAYLTCRKTDKIVDVTPIQILLGYHPLIIGIPVDNNSDKFLRSLDGKRICIWFQTKKPSLNSSWRGFPIDSRSQARLILKHFGTKNFEQGDFYIFVGEHGQHKLLSRFHQLSNQLWEKFKRKPPNNIYLRGNLHEQVRIAYAHPREISLITIGDGNLFNMFPTDLHGPVFDSWYVGSLRKAGMACAQVDRLKKVVLSRINASYYHHAYQLGRNHIEDLRPTSSFDFSSRLSEVYKLPIPNPTQSYCEMKQIDTIDIDLHRLHFYEVANRKKLKVDQPALAHVHQYYVQWRLTHGLKGQYLQRSS